MAYQGFPGGGYPGQGAPGGYPTQGGGHPGFNPGQQGGYPGQQGGYPGQQGGHPGQQGGYAGYNPPQGGYAPPPTQAPSVPGALSDVQRIFSAVDTDRSGRISAKELQGALQNGQGQGFSDKCCQLMISMFDHANTGTVDIQAFTKLFEYVNQWLTIFKTYDRNSSGLIDDQELNQAFTQMGFNFSPQFTKQLVTRSQNKKEITVDEFIVLCVTVQRLTEAFRVRDTQHNGVISINFEDFLSVVLTNTN